MESIIDRGFFVTKGKATKMSEEAKGTITIVKDGRTATMFPAPSNSYAARQLWVFLVENLRPVGGDGCFD